MTEYTSLSKVSIYHEVMARLPEPNLSNTFIGISDRAQRIFMHYQKTWERARRKDHLYLDTLVSACINNLAGTNGIDSGREVRL